MHSLCVLSRSRSIAVYLPAPCSLYRRALTRALLFLGALGVPALYRPLSLRRSIAALLFHANHSVGCVHV